MAQIQLTEELKEKWSDVIDADGLPAITDPTIRNNTIRLLEQEYLALQETTTNTMGTSTAASNTNTDSISQWDPVLISLVRRTQPSLIANDFFGVQPMSGPTGLVFAMKSNITPAGAALIADIYSPQVAPNPNHTGSGTGGAATTTHDETLGMTDNVVGAGGVQATVDGVGVVAPVTSSLTVAPAVPWSEMSFKIDNIAVTAGSRSLKASYSIELAQDLRATHGLDAETELANLVSGEITAEINREVIATLLSQAIPTLNKVGVPGTAYDFFDYSGITVTNEYSVAAGGDSQGRWEQEHYKNIIGIINKVAHEVALGTRRGLGNKVLTSPAVAAALQSASILDPRQDVKGGVNFGNDNVGVTYAGRLLNRIDVYVDPFMTVDTIVVGYRGGTSYDAGYMYCPYVALTMMKAIDSDSMQPVIGFKTRYGMVQNPFTSGVAAQNWYFRKFNIVGL